MGARRYRYGGWKLIICPGRPCIGSGGQGRPPHRIVMEKGRSPAMVEAALHHQIDAIEDAGPGLAAPAR
jgi:hypothetical protein